MPKPPPEIEPPDIHFLRAAEGWMELGLPREAEAELSYLSAEAARHPQSLNTRWAVHAELGAWKLAYVAAEELIACAREDVAGWVHRAFSARRMEGGGLQAAWDALRPAAELFPDEPLVPYNLACYACQLGRLDAARHWIEVARLAAAKRKGDAVLKQMALADSDLTSIRDHIAAW